MGLLDKYTKSQEEKDANLLVSVRDNDVPGTKEWLKNGADPNSMYDALEAIGNNKAIASIGKVIAEVNKLTPQGPLNPKERRDGILELAATNPLQLACRSEGKDSVNITKELLKNGADPKRLVGDQSPPLNHMAAKDSIDEHDLLKIDLLLKNGESLDACSPQGVKDTVLHVAAYHGHTELVSTLLDDYNMDANVENIMGHTAIISAINGAQAQNNDMDQTKKTINTLMEHKGGLSQKEINAASVLVKQEDGLTKEERDKLTQEEKNAATKDFFQKINEQPSKSPEEQQANVKGANKEAPEVEKPKKQEQERSAPAPGGLAPKEEKVNKPKSSNPFRKAMDKRKHEATVKKEVKSLVKTEKELVAEGDSLNKEKAGLDGELEEQETKLKGHQEKRGKQDDAGMQEFDATPKFKELEALRESAQQPPSEMDSRDVKETRALLNLAEAGAKGDVKAASTSIEEIKANDIDLDTLINVGDGEYMPAFMSIVGKNSLEQSNDEYKELQSETAFNKSLKQDLDKLGDDPAKEDVQGLRDSIQAKHDKANSFHETDQKSYEADMEIFDTKMQEYNDGKISKKPKEPAPPKDPTQMKESERKLEVLDKALDNDGKGFDQETFRQSREELATNLEQGQAKIGVMQETLIENKSQIADLFKDEELKFNPDAPGLTAGLNADPKNAKTFLSGVKGQFNDAMLEKVAEVRDARGCEGEGKTFEKDDKTCQTYKDGQAFEKYTEVKNEIAEIEDCIKEVDEKLNVNKQKVEKNQEQQANVKGGKKEAPEAEKPLVTESENLNKEKEDLNGEVEELELQQGEAFVEVEELEPQQGKMGSNQVPDLEGPENIASDVPELSTPAQKAEAVPVEQEKPNIPELDLEGVEPSTPEERMADRAAHNQENIPVLDLEGVEPSTKEERGEEAKITEEDKQKDLDAAIPKVDAEENAPENQALPPQEPPLEVAVDSKKIKPLKSSAEQELITTVQDLADAMQNMVEAPQQTASQDPKDKEEDKGEDREQFGIASEQSEETNKESGGIPKNLRLAAKLAAAEGLTGVELDGKQQEGNVEELSIENIKEGLKDVKHQSGAVDSPSSSPQGNKQQASQER